MDDAASAGGRSAPGTPPEERRSGLALETCYRHPSEVTGVHCTRCGRPICPECMTSAPVGYQCPECVRQAGRAAYGRGWRVRLSLGRPGIVTSTLLAVNILMFLIEVAVGGSRSLFLGGSTAKLIDLGAEFAPAIARGQYWRLFTAMFLHAGLLHLALNMYALYLFGYLIERTFGPLRFLAIYFLCGFMASVASFAFGPIAAGVGASGAIFGLLGAWVAFNYRRREMRFNRAALRSALVLIGINLFLGFSIAGIDNLAHIGGLVTGVVAGTLAEGFGSRGVRLLVRYGGFVAIVAIGVALTAWRIADINSNAFQFFRFPPG